MSLLPMLPEAVRNYLIDNICRELLDLASEAKHSSAEKGHNILEDKNNDVSQRYNILIAAASEMGREVLLVGVYEEGTATSAGKWSFKLRG